MRDFFFNFRTPIHFLPHKLTHIKSKMERRASIYIITFTFFPFFHGQKNTALHHNNYADEVPLFPAHLLKKHLSKPSMRMMGINFLKPLSFFASLTFRGVSSLKTSRVPKIFPQAFLSILHSNCCKSRSKYKYSYAHATACQVGKSVLPQKRVQ